MKKVKHILTVFLKSFIPQDHFYPKLLHTRLLFSFKYYLSILSFICLMFAGVLFYQHSPTNITSYKDAIIHTLSTFPSEVEISIAQGTLESNQMKPLFLWVYLKNQPLFVFMIHSKDSLNTSNTPLPLIFLGSDRAQITYRNQTMVQQYDKALDIILTKDTVTALSVWIQSMFTPFLFGFYFILLVILPLVVALSISLVILLSAFISFILLRTFIPHIHFKKCLQAGMHGTHIPLFITVLLFSLCPQSLNIIGISIILIFVFTLVATYEMYSKEVPSHFKGR